jgi:hypothetical protein
MKGGARAGAGRKKKAAAKKTAMQKKKSQEMEGAPRSSVGAEERINKHKSYMKIQKGEDSGKHTISGVAGENVFYCGTYDADLTTNIADQVFHACMTGDKLTEQSTRRINATFAAILETDPQDATELMLATQMTTIHNAAMNLSGRALKNDQPIELASFYINGIAKLMRTYTTQMEALSKYRNKGKQQITVKHQHVNVNDGGQAVIGDVNQGGGNG